MQKGDFTKTFEEVLYHTVLTDPLRLLAFFCGYLAGRFINVTIDRRSKESEDKKNDPVNVPFTAALLTNKHDDLL